MGEARRQHESLAAAIRELDSKLPSPEKRASHIFSILRNEHPELTDWDLLCFATNYIAFMTQAFPWLEKEAKALNNLVYTAHYVATEESNANSTGIHREAEPQHNEAERKREEERSSFCDGLSITRITD